MSEPKGRYSEKRSQAPYDEDFHFYRDLDPDEIAGGDGVDSNILKAGNFPQGGRKS